MQPRGFFFLRRLSSRFVPRWVDEKKTKEETRHVSQWESNCAAQGTFVLPHRSLHCFPALSRTKERNRGLDSSDLSLNRFFEGVLDGLLISVRSTDEEKSHRENILRGHAQPLFYFPLIIVHKVVRVLVHGFSYHLRERQRSMNIFTPVSRLSNRHHGG